MSKFFYKGKIEKRPKYESFGFSTKRNIKPGSAEKPLQLRVQTEARKLELETQLSELQLIANIVLAPETEEDIQALKVLLDTPQTAIFDKTPKRNDPCDCGSGKKYKKCCG
ncbi:PBPRA1643 family SWIM/SEC-C metal-binding motif protein [Agarivorans sp. QJM3NY_33]|uniref:PBPRA1643 family SWIM/SEC-C metal-binding motif protein n=1 Tax=Agarivorans sp. QJM3NY_33 TaxID=3421432 RepID=UPI003D7D4EEA